MDRETVEKLARQARLEIRDPAAYAADLDRILALMDTIRAEVPPRIATHDEARRRPVAGGGPAPVCHVRDAVARGEVSAVEVAEGCLARIERLDGGYGCFLHVDREGALAAARACDERLAAGEAARYLEGVPIGVKDNIAVRGMPMTAGSRVLEGFALPEDATAVERIRRAGAVIVGKLNMDEFGMGSSNESSAFGPVRNPWDPTRVPGGSSGGAAAAVALGFVRAALGSDTGGSVRQPAAFCGVTGFRPSYGRVSRSGLVAFASSLDQIGPVARDVAGAARLFNVIAGEDPKDSTTAPGEVPSCDRALDPAGLRVGVAEGGPEVDADVAASVDAALGALADAGAEIVPVRLSSVEPGLAAYYLIADAEASANLARYGGHRYGHGRERFGREVVRRILLGTFALSAGYEERLYRRALAVRRRLADEYAAAFAAVDVIVGPTAPTAAAFRIGERSADPVAMYLSDVLTVPAALAGLPAVSVPGRPSADGLPIGIQLTGPALRDHRAVGAARALQSLTDWHETLAPEAAA